jgi:hypothetical protein
MLTTRRATVGLAIGRLLGLKTLRAAVAPSSDHHGLDLIVWSLVGDVHGPRGTSDPIPTWRVTVLCAVGTPSRGGGHI